MTAPACDCLAKLRKGTRACLACVLVVVDYARLHGDTAASIKYGPSIGTIANWRKRRS